MSARIASGSSAAIGLALCALAAVGAASIIATSFAAYPVGTDGWLHATRYTARFSNDASVRALGARNWKRLHTVGIYWLWFIFFATYAAGVAAGKHFCLSFILVMLAALAPESAA